MNFLIFRLIFSNYPVLTKTCLFGIVNHQQQAKSSWSKALRTENNHFRVTIFRSLSLSLVKYCVAIETVKTGQYTDPLFPSEPSVLAA